MYRWENNIKIDYKYCNLQETNEHGNELLDSVKGREFLDRLKDLHFFSNTQLLSLPVSIRTR
jgi:hypothetical protein